MTPEGLTFTIPRVPNADDAEITGEAASELSTWMPAELMGMSATTLTFRVPASLQSGRRVFLRATVRLR